MRRIRAVYIHQNPDWPDFAWNTKVLLPILSGIRYKQGKLKGNLEALGFTTRNETTLQTLTLDVLKSSEIEGEHFDMQQVRSSVARHLGLDIAGMVPADRQIDGVVEMMLDATQNYSRKLTRDRLFGWHTALFPAGRSGLHKITVGAWRNNEKGPMQVVSGAMGKEKIHFEAPEGNRLRSEMKLFLNWFNSEHDLDPVLKSGIAHLWFITIHPFDDGNGRIARAIADLQLTRADDDPQRFYSMSAQIRIERKLYYEMLESTQKGDLDITQWLHWYLKCFERALDTTARRLKIVLDKTKFWDKFRTTDVNERQRKIINKLFDGFEGNLTTSKWAKINKCSADTALRDIQDLMQKGIVKKQEAGGRSTGYELKGW